MFAQVHEEMRQLDAGPTSDSVDIAVTQYTTQPPIRIRADVLNQLSQATGMATNDVDNDNHGRIFLDKWLGPKKNQLTPKKQKEKGTTNISKVN